MYNTGVNLPLLRTAVTWNKYSAAVNEKPIHRPGTDTALDLWFSQTLHFCPIGNLCPTKKVSSLSLSLCKGGGRGLAVTCTFLTQLAGPYFSRCTSLLSGTSPSFISSLSLPPVLSAPLCRCQSLTPLKEPTLCCAAIADVSSRCDWQSGLLASSPGVSGALTGRGVCMHELLWYIGMYWSVWAAVCVCACGRWVYEVSACQTQ